MRDLGREMVWSSAAERLVSLPGFPSWRAEEVGVLLAQAFIPIFPWESKRERSTDLASRADARRRLRDMIEDQLGIILP